MTTNGNKPFHPKMAKKQVKKTIYNRYLNANGIIANQLRNWRFCDKGALGHKVEIDPFACLIDLIHI